MTKTDKPTPKPKAKVSLSDQIADVVVKAVRTGGVTVGGAGAFWSLFNDSDIPKALASGVIGLGISYGASLLNPVHKGTQDRLTKAGEAANKAIDHGIAKVSGVEEQYFRCQAWACRRQKSEGVIQHDGIFRPLLEEIYVPLQLDRNSLPSGLRESPMQHPTKLSFNEMQESEIWDFLSKTWKDSNFMTHSQIGVLAWGGYGKTTLLKHIAYTYGMNQQGKYGVPRRVPFLLVLRKHRDLLAQEQPPTLPELIRNHHIPDLPDFDKLADLPKDWVKKKLNQGEAVVMLDGFDEVASGQRPVVARWINDQMRHYSKSVFIVTSRPKAYKDQELVDRLELPILWVQDFSESQRRNFVENWYLYQEQYASGGELTPDVEHAAKTAAEELLTQIEARQELKDLARNPLLLNMIVSFHWRYPGAELPKRRVELYREICTLQLRDRPRARKLKTCLIDCEAQLILQRLALSMMEAHEERLGHSDLEERIKKYIKLQQEQVEQKNFLAEVVQISELLVERELGEFEFAHLSLQEYLAATQIADDKQEALLYKHLQNDWWKQTILLYASQVNPTPLIREALRQEAIDLAYTIQQDTTKRLDLTAEELAAFEKTTSQVETSRYANLETLLQTQQWREADQETYRLMITTVGKEEGQYLNSDDLKTFPCDDLQMLDRLWVKYSDGKWGFSVQKRIWEECGSPTDYNEFTRTFCDRIGWTNNGKWQNPTYDLENSLDGELPFGFEGELPLGILSSLAQSLLSRKDL
ncbi:GUN4 domain-containing protein [Acaryochloris marina]|uniref:GUN4 domain-containing protein n=1 Tax=Acaryochloris marina TaxID=155978 RepID=UPI001BB00FC9|nr:GUN4 domain-containing protein [Acaryochloris marina]QUY42314.1 GUN4 domain-containing protein [Acaryochloris marina S15]